MEPDRAKEIAEEYMSSLADLTINSKPLITMLTILAEENIEYAPAIVETIEKHITSVRPDFKLPILYLIDSIVKNIQPYRKHFNMKIANIFCDVFSKVNEKIREKMYQLRQTWNDVFPQTKLYTLDIKTSHIDPNWPITAQVQTSKSPAIHVNPNFFKKQQGAEVLTDELRKKQMQLIELEKRKQELEQAVSKKTQSVQNKQQHQPPVQMSKAPVAGAPMPSIASLPPIPKKNRMNSRDPRLAKQQSNENKTEVPAKRSKSDNRHTPSQPNGAGDEVQAPAKASGEYSKSDRSKTEASPKKKSSDERNKNKTSSSRSTASSSSVSSSSKRNDRSDRKRHRSPSNKTSGKRSRDKSPDVVVESGKREKKTGNSSNVPSRLEPRGDRRQISSPKKLSADVDLRVPIKTNDVDLRGIPVESIDITDDEPEVQRNRNIDELFGFQDLDLRTMGTGKLPAAPSVHESKVSNAKKLEEARAKLTEASKKKDKLGRPLLYNQLPKDPLERKRKISVDSKPMDWDLRAHIRDDMSQEDLNQSMNIILSQAQEQHANNQMNAEQYGNLVKQVFNINQAFKLRQKQIHDAKRLNRISPIPPLVIGNITPPQIFNNNETSNGAVAELSVTTNVVNPWNAQISALQIPQMQMQTITPVQPVTLVTISSQDDLVRTINIDGIPRGIRFYDETAIVFLSDDDAREIGFESGQRQLTVDGIETLDLKFNDNYQSIVINGKVHQIRLGAPTRELYIDKLPYECIIGGPALPILIDNVIRYIGVNGPEPKVKIGEQRPDLVLGIIKMIINAQVEIPFYLDSKIQSFEMPDSSRHTLQVVDNLATIIIDGVPIHNVEYGGLPVRFKLGNKTHFIRFTTLPKGVSVGKPNTNVIQPTQSITSSLDTVLSSSPNTTIEEAPVVVPISDSNPTTADTVPTSTTITTTVEESVSTVTSSTTTLPEVSASTVEVPSSTAAVPVIPGLPNVNIEDLYRRLIMSGIIGGGAKQPEPDAEPKPEEIHVIDLSKPETIKKRSSGLVDALFIGMQCSSCGVRFPPEQTMRYSQHLDWHFRQNRRERDASKKAHSRKWYYDVSDWIQYEEIEDLEEREKNWFEKHGPQAEFDVEEMDKSPGNQMISCPAGPKGAEETCEVCHDKFEYFFHEDTEDWHLKNAIRVEEKAYHPTCYDDLKAAAERAIQNEQAITSDGDVSKMEVDDSFIEENQEKTEETEDDAEKGDENDKNEPMEEDDDVIVLPPQNPIITEIVDDDDDEKGYRLNEIEDTTVDSPKIENLKEKDENPLSVEEYTPLDMSEIKVKEEPFDEMYESQEDDAFEDVGTIEISVIDDQPIENDTISLGENNSLPANENSTSMPPGSPANDTIADNNLSITQTYGAPITVNKIRINITKPLAPNSPSTHKELETPVHSPEPVEEELEEEPEPEYELKPQLRETEFKKLAPSIVGCETSGLCCIM